MSKVTARLMARITKLPQILIVVLIAALVSIARLLIIHYYVDWRFLWGGDQVPILNFSDFIRSVFEFELPWRELGFLFLPQLSLVTLDWGLRTLISNILNEGIVSNVSGWIVNTLLFFIGSLLLLYVVNMFNYCDKLHRYITYMLTLTFFSFNPWSTIDTFKSYLGMTSLREFLMFIIIAFYFRLLKNVYDLKTISIPEVLLIVASTIALYSLSPSSVIRGLALILSLQLIFVIFALLTYCTVQKCRPNRSISKLLYIIALSAIPLLSLVMILPIYMSTGYLELLKGRVISTWGSLTPPEKILHPPYATLLNSLIGMNSWIAHSPYMPYHMIYEQGIIAALMLLWPCLALGVSLLTLGSKSCLGMVDKLQILALISTCIAFIAWGTGLNPPLVFLKQLIVQLLPLAPKIIPWGFTIHLIRFTYTLMTSYVVGYVISAALRLYTRDKVRGIAYLVTAILVLISLLTTAAPIFTGQVFGQYYNQNIRGFVIPHDYEVLASLKTRFYEHIALLPITSTYASTEWGWQGSTAWYNRLNTGILVRSFIPYISYCTEWDKLYQKLARPSLKLQNTTLILTKYVKLEGIKCQNCKMLNKYVSSDGTINLKVILLPKRRYADILLPLTHPLNLSAYSALEIELNMKSERDYSYFIQPILFICSKTYCGVHILPSVRTPAHIIKTYAVGEPDRPWPSSRYDVSHVTGLILRIKISKIVPGRNFPLIISIRLSVGNNVTISQDYVHLLNLLHIRYIVIDKTLRSYYEYEKYYRLVEIALRRAFKVVYNGSALTIFEVENLSECPVVFLNANTCVKRVFCRATNPVRVLLKVYTVNYCKNLTLVLPILFTYGESIKPITLIIKNQSASISYKEVNYQGLLGYLINGIRKQKLIIEITYSEGFIVIYVLSIILSLAPIVLLIVAGALYLKNMMRKA